MLEETKLVLIIKDRQCTIMSNNDKVIHVCHTVEEVKKTIRYFRLINASFIGHSGFDWSLSVLYLYPNTEQLPQNLCCNGRLKKERKSVLN